MRRPTLVFILVTAAAVGGGLVTGAGPAGASTAVGGWGPAQEVPGLAALDTPGGSAKIASVSCASAGNCAAGGYYVEYGGSRQAFVVNEVGGSWKTAQEVPGSAALNTGGSATVKSVSCASAGDCAAGGYYQDSSGHLQAFVVDEVGGSWKTAQEVPGSAVLNTGGHAEVDAVSCAPAGDCVAGGFFDSASGFTYQPFVVNEAGGSWKTAQQVPGAVNAGGYGGVTSVSCPQSGDCAAGGYYSNSAGNWLPFVVNEVDGSWKTAQQVPGLIALNTGGVNAWLGSVSCAKPGDCAAGGRYQDSSGNFQAFVVDEAGGSWDQAQQVPGTATLNAGGYAEVTSVSCPSAGDCAAGGSYENASKSGGPAFVVDEAGGSWKTAQQVPGLATLNTGGAAQVTSVSCPSAGDCAAGGIYKDSSGDTQGFVVDEAGGSWGQAQQVPGLAALNAGGHAEVTSVSCVSGGACAAGGYYTDSGQFPQAFVVNEPGDLGSYHPVGPTRVLDTRYGTGGFHNPVGPNSSIALQITGKNGVPASGVTAVALNVTAVNGTRSSYVTVYPDGQARPVASSLNFTAGEVIPNLVTVPVGPDGKIRFYNHAGSVNLVADLAGYYLSGTGGSLFNPVGPTRVLDTRYGTGAPKGKVGPGKTITLKVTGANVPAGAKAVVLNVTAVNATASSYVTVYPGGAKRPLASNLNFTKGDTFPNLVIVPVGSSGTVSFYNHSGSVDLVADLAGYFAASGDQFASMGPVRVLDTRDGTGVPEGKVGPGQSITLQVTGKDGAPAIGASAVVLNVTAVNATRASYVTVSPGCMARPKTSNLNFQAGEVFPNLVVVPVGCDGTISFYNNSGSVDLVADLAGYYPSG